MSSVITLLSILWDVVGHGETKLIDPEYLITFYFYFKNSHPFLDNFSILFSVSKCGVTAYILFLLLRRSTSVG